MKKHLRGVYLITDTVIQHRFTHAELTAQALEAGVHMIQYRDKQAGANMALQQVKEISRMTKPADTLFIVNDRADIALAGRADGVHLGQNDLPIPVARKLLGEEKIIGGTSSTLREAMQVEREGADYVAVGHIFETTTKEKNYPPRGLDTLRAVSEALSIPVVAIGGITPENAPEVILAGADIIAVSSAICGAADPLQQAKAFVDLFR